MVFSHQIIGEKGLYKQNQRLVKVIIGFVFLFSILATSSNVVANEVLQQDAEVLALKYTGYILNKDPKAVPKSCEFFISNDILMYGSLVDGEALPAVTPIPLYYDSAKPLGSRFAPITEPQGAGVLAFVFIELNIDGLSAGANADPNKITDLISKDQVEISMILIFKPGVSFEDFDFSMSKVLNDNLEVPSQKNTLDMVDTLNLSLWHMGHYDIPRCVATGFDSVQKIDLVSSDHHEDEASHQEDKDGHDHSAEENEHQHEGQ